MQALKSIVPSETASKVFGILIKVIPILIAVGGQIYAMISWMDNIETEQALTKQAMTLRIDNIKQSYEAQLASIRQEHSSSLVNLKLQQKHAERSNVVAREAIQATICIIEEAHKELDEDITEELHTMHTVLKYVPILQNKIHAIDRNSTVLRKEVRDAVTDVAVIKTVLKL